MKGCTVAQFIDDLLISGGPEKEFVFQDRYYFLETTLRQDKGMLEMILAEYDNTDPKDKKHLGTHSFWGHDLAECTDEFVKAPIFGGRAFYEAEQDIELLFG